MKQTKQRKPTKAELIERWIEPNPNKPSKDEAVIKGYYVPVWALIGHGAAPEGDPRPIAEDYDLPVEAVEAAFTYYRRNRAFIDVRLAQNAARIEE